MKILLCLATTLLLNAAAARADPVLIFGLPLGGKPVKPLRVCAEGVYPAKSLCWIGHPRRGTGGALSGGVNLPDPDNRPVWAAHAMFDLWVAGDGQIDRLAVRSDTSYGTTRGDIVGSISARFGAATQTTQHGAEWTSPGAHIEMLCSPGEWCRVSFSSARAAAEEAREAAVRRQRDAKRPVSP